MPEIIINGNLERQKEEKFKIIAVNALKLMSDTLVEMEKLSMNSEEMMNRCVWPILEMAEEKFNKIEKGEEVDTSISI